VTSPQVSAVVFDLGGVLIDWDPRHLYRGLFDGDEEAMEAFLADVCTAEWNARQDAGRPWSEAIAELVARFPDRREFIEAYRARWPEMLAGPIEGTVEVLADLRRGGIGLYALSNWSAETFAIARPMFPFLDWFDGIVVSGELGIVKPDPRIFRHLLERYGLDAGSSLFVDDHEPNVEAARRVGLQVTRFEDPVQLREDLRAFGLLDGAA
jgi:2-haloacid dehalogenase